MGTVQSVLITAVLSADESHFVKNRARETSAHLLKETKPTLSLYS